MTKTRMLVGYGTGTDLNLVAFEYHTSIKEERNSLITQKDEKLDLIGRLQGMTFLMRDPDDSERVQRFFSSKPMNKLSYVTLIVLQDGRVFENPTREHPEPSETSSARQYIQQIFAGGDFDAVFGSLYNQYKMNGTPNL